MIVISTFIIPLLSLSLYLGCLEGWEQQMTMKLFLDQQPWHYSKRNKKRNPRPAPEEIAVSPDVGWTWTRSWQSARRSSQKCGRSWCPTRGTIWRYTLAAWQWRWAFQPGIPGKHLKIDGIYGCEWHQKNATFPFLTHFHFYDLRPSLVFAWCNTWSKASTWSLQPLGQWGPIAWTLLWELGELLTNIILIGMSCMYI